MTPFRANVVETVLRKAAGSGDSPLVAVPSRSRARLPIENVPPFPQAAPLRARLSALIRQNEHHDRYAAAANCSRRTDSYVAKTATVRP